MSTHLPLLPGSGSGQTKLTLSGEHNRRRFCSRRIRVEPSFGPFRFSDDKTEPSIVSIAMKFETAVPNQCTLSTLANINFDPAESVRSRSTIIASNCSHHQPLTVANGESLGVNLDCQGLSGRM